ncbi:MAG: hypothetical protein ACU0DK_12870 [Pseudooceanicola sp.]
MSLRPVLALCLALLLTVTGQAAAIARGQPGPAGYAEICTGTGPVMVALDSAGQPLGPAHLCPDNAYLLMQALGLPPALPPHRPAAHRVAFADGETAVHAPLSGAALARGPPFPS